MCCKRNETHIFLIFLYLCSIRISTYEEREYHIKIIEKYLF